MLQELNHLIRKYRKILGAHFFQFDYFPFDLDLFQAKNYKYSHGNY